MLYIHGKLLNKSVNWMEVDRKTWK